MSNCLQLKASIAELGTLRHTPAGIAAINLVLEHHSEILAEPLAALASKPRSKSSSEGPAMRQIGLIMKAVAFGTLAEKVAALPLVCSSAEAKSAAAVQYRFSGYLTNVRGGKGVVLQLQSVVL